MTIEGEDLVISKLISLANADKQYLPADDSLLVELNRAALIEALIEQRLVNPEAKTAPEQDYIEHGKYGSFYVSFSSLLNMKQIPAELATLLLDFTFGQTQIRGKLLVLLIKRIIQSFSILNNNEIEVIGQFEAQAKKQQQSMYDAAIHHRDLEKGFDPDGTVPFEKTLKSLEEKGILKNSSGDYYRLIR